MKKFKNTFPCYGQSTAGRIAYYQKMGVAQGIISMLYDEMKKEKKSLKDYTKVIWKNCEETVTETKVCIGLPVTPIKTKDWLREDKYPVFETNVGARIIDQLAFGSELQFHSLIYKYKTKEYIDGGWHTVRECLTLEQTCTLFEWVEDVINNTEILEP